MKLSNKQKYTVYIGVVLIALMALFAHEFSDYEHNTYEEVESKNVNIYD